MADPYERDSTPKNSGKQIAKQSQSTPDNQENISKVHGKEIICQDQRTDLTGLKPTDFDRTLHVKVYCKWTTTNRASIPAMHHCILLDQQVRFYICIYYYYTDYILIYRLFALFRGKPFKQISSPVKKTVLTCFR